MENNKGINVLSCFDGMSCGRIALERAGIQVDDYYSSEIKPYAIKVANKNYPQDEQNRLGDVRLLNTSILNNIDLLIGGSPCQSFSFAGKAEGMKTECDIEIFDLEHYLFLKKQSFQFKGQSYLFWEFIRIFKEIDPKYFLLENVNMSKKWQDVISNVLGVEPIAINSSKFSAQNRPRLYWTNIKIFEIPTANNTCIYDILEENAKFDNKYAGWMMNKWGEKRRLDMFFNASGKASCLTANMAKGQKATYCINDEKEIHKFTPIECERLQTVPDNYTEGVANSHRTFMLGNGWTVDVIAHILKGLKN